MPTASPTQRTLAKLRKEGYRAQVVEHWNPFAKIRQDLFGIIDVVGIGNGETIGVQATSYSNVSSRVKKIAESEAIGDLRDSGWKVQVWGWRKKGRRYECRTVDVS